MIGGWGIEWGKGGGREGLLMLVVDVSEKPAWVIWASVTLYIRRLFGFNEGYLRMFIINHFPINAEREHKVGN